MGTLSSELRPLAAEMTAVPRVYVDANVPQPSVAFMRQTLHWDVLFVIEDDELRRAHDRVHFSRARDLGRTLITQDRDFADEAKYPRALSPGVIVISATHEAALHRILRYIDRELLRRAGGEAPLVGRILEMAIDDLQAG